MQATQLTESGPSAAAAPIAGTPAGTVMTPEYVAVVGRFAYVWGWPLVNNLNRSLGMKDDRGLGSGAEWKFTDPIHKLAFDVRYEWQYGAQLRTQGKILIFSITYLDFQPPLKK